jgi:hypothetical protein
MAWSLFAGYAVRGFIQTSRKRFQVLRLPAKPEGPESYQSIAGKSSFPIYARNAVIPTNDADSAGYVKAARGRKNNALYVAIETK